MITNGYSSDISLDRLPVESVFLYRPAEPWTYSHHASITFFKGRFHAIWSNGHKDEDAPGQRVLWATSQDSLSWSEAVPLVDSRRGEHSEVVLTAAGFHQHAGTLVAYFGQYEYSAASLAGEHRSPGDAGHERTSLWAVSTADGRTWSTLVPMGVPVVPNHGPQPTATGRLIIAGNVSFPYTDDPAGVSGWTMAGIYPPGMAATLQDDSEGFWIVKERVGWPVGLCEGSFFQTDDGTLHMMLRSNVDRLWVTESRDDGATWTAPRETDFTDNATKFHFGRLPDGRFYYVGCPDPVPRWSRHRLVLSLSGDGERFDRHFVVGDEPYEQKYQGLHKGGNYGYPHSMIKDGYLYVIVSRGKEAVTVSRIALAQIQ